MVRSAIRLHLGLRVSPIILLPHSGEQDTIRFAGCSISWEITIDLRM